jgi:hypothetical protein
MRRARIEFSWSDFLGDESLHPIHRENPAMVTADFEIIFVLPLLKPKNAVTQRTQRAGMLRRRTAFMALHRPDCKRPGNLMRRAMMQVEAA